MSVIIRGIKIRLGDQLSPKTPNAAYGLYAIQTTGPGSLAIGATSIALTNGTHIGPGSALYVNDGTNSEFVFVRLKIGHTVYLTVPLRNAYSGTINVYGGTEFRWVENAVDATSETWKSGLITENGIGEYSRAINLEQCGAVADDGSASVTLINTNQFQKFLSDNTINLEGKEFLVYTSDGAGTFTPRWIGECQKPDYDARTYQIGAVGLGNHRDVDIAPVITSDKYPNADDDIKNTKLPMTFGTLTYATLLRTANRETIKPNDAYYPVTYTDPRGNKVFAVIPIASPYAVTEPVTTYRIKTGLNALGSDITQQHMGNITGMYVRVIQGSGNNTPTFTSLVGEARKITGIGTQTSVAFFDVEIDLPFTANFACNAAATDDHQVWVEIVDIDGIYTADEWPCAGFCTMENVLLSSTSSRPTVMTFDGDTRGIIQDDDETVIIEKDKDDYREIPQSAFNVSTNAEKNEIDIDVKGFSQNTEDIAAHTIIPMESVALCTKANLNGWQTSSGVNAYTADYYMGNGVHLLHDTPVTFFTETSVVPATVIDKDGDTSMKWFFEIWQPVYDPESVYIVLEVKLPPRPVDKYDAAYLGVDLSFFADDNTTASIGIAMCPKKFIGLCTNESVYGGVSVGDPGDTTRYTNIPSWYFAANPSAYADAGFLFEPLVKSDGGVTYRGGKIGLELNGLNDPKKYDASIDNIVVIAITSTSGDANLAKICVDLRELAIIFEKKQSISSTVYSPMKGRLADQTWETGETPTTLLENPQSVLQHLCKLGNVNSAPDTATASLFGSAYDNAARVDYADFVDSIFDSRIKAAGQIIGGDTKTRSLKNVLCRNFSLANWINPDGEERCASVAPPSSASATALTLDDIVDRSSIKITEPNSVNIFPAPFVRYAYDYGAKQYTKTIEFTRPWAPTYKSEYVIDTQGILTAAQKEEYWTKCRALWVKTQKSEVPPSDMTDLKFADGPNGYYVAALRIKNWIDWMSNPTIEFSVPLATALDWEECQRFSISLPHQTNLVAYEAIVTKLQFKTSTVTVTAVLFSSYTTGPLYLQDVLGDGTLNYQDAVGSSTDLQDIVI